MPFFRRAVRTSTVAGAIASLVACSQSPATMPSAAGRPELSLAGFRDAVAPYVAALEQAGRISDAAPARSWLDQKAIDRNADLTSFDPSAKSLVYATVYGKKLIDIYQPGLAADNSNPAMVGQIVLPHTPSGLAVDRNQNLYAAVYIVGIEVFSKTSVTAPIRILQDPYAPQGLSVGPDGTVYAGNQSADATGNVGISVFPPGATTASKTLDDPAIHYVFTTGVDAQSNVYLTYLDNATNRALFGVFRAGSSTMTKLPLVNETYAAELDAKGGIVAADPDTASIDTYPNESASPSASFVTESQADFFFFAQTSTRNTIYTEPLNSANGLTGGPILEFANPGGKQLDTISHGDAYAFGIVTAPAPPYAPPYYPSVAAAPTIAPSGTMTPGACTNGAAAPKLDSRNDLLYYTAAVQCAGPGVPYNISATATLYDAKTGGVLEAFSGGERAANYYKQVAVPCPGIGSYYTIVTSNVAPAVRSATATGTGC